ncbi:restriction endonuclease subunit S [Pseudoflavonifractor sp. An85]|uniref:restriction endonuclease subunit S n=1 Tax=Pseudoflavonifractor sp. An85 TaxID=1965661 RepID=UPI000B3878CB|nr:restriction endonuclease subunit S [Pseudoflavonifractor sp. An85]OUN19223.1 hypothetical protein B5G37_13735 [Pseudoflavonifractor sp. An85]
MARLGDICKFQSGGTPSKSNPDFFGGNIPWITTVALNGGIINSTNAVEWITDKAIQESAAKIVPQDSIMIGTRVGIGKVAINSGPMSTSQDVISLLDIDTASWDKAFLCKFIIAKNDFLLSQARGATIKGIKIDTLSNLQVPDISLEEQRRIATLLDKVSDLIAKRRAQLDKLDLLVKAKFVEMFQEENRRKTISDICSIITDGTHQPPKFVPEGIPFLFVSNVISNEITYETEKYISQETYDELIKRTPIEPGDILLSTVGSYGHPAIVKDNKKFLFQRHIAYLKPNHDMVCSQYLHSALLSYDVQRQIEEKVKGVAQKTLNLSEVRKISLPVPTMDVQLDFCKYVEKVNEEKANMKLSFENLETLKKALMQQYFG